MARWTQPEHTKSKVNNSGKTLINPTATSADILESLEVINNWKSSHAYPLNTFQATLRNRVKTVDKNATIAQRIKRLESIERKLMREKSMALSNMQDIGGIRAIVKDINSARMLDRKYAAQTLYGKYTSINLNHELVKRNDYIDTPKPSGYRGVHLIFRYNNNRPEAIPYNGLLIELQIRSKLQHLWATAVETAEIFSSQALKASDGQAEWLRFFALSGSILSNHEKTPLVPNTPTDKKELTKELSDLVQSFDIFKKFDAFTVAAKSIGSKHHKGKKIFLLVINLKTRILRIESFKENETEKATDHYLQVEKQAKQSAGINAVLVSVDSFRALPLAYPNYFADTRLFTKAIRSSLV
ncbi:MAG: RelA/SpoT domain-containing protein [Deltaproteobacteria bacterium]|nr:RelA/SpoT domain-containing protein [Deltaproteobacteria bacterium]